MERTKHHALHPSAAVLAAKVAARFTIGITAVFALPAAAQATPDPLASRDLTPLISALDAPDLAQREAAVETLLTDQRITLREILGLLAEVTALTPEQRARLNGAAREMFALSPRAAMGVQFGGTVEKGVAIQSAVDGFDSARVIRPGDVVLAANGIEVTQTRLRAIILSHDPGESMVIRLRRLSEDGTEEIVESRVTLGSMNRLRGGGFIDAGTMFEAWRERLARAGVSEAPSQAPIQSDVDHAQWLASAQAVARSGQRDAGPGAGPGTARAPIASISGEPRTAWIEPGLDRFAMQDEDALEPLRADRRAQERMALIQELTDLQRELTVLRAAFRANAATLQGQALTDAQRARLTFENQRLTTEAAAVEARMSELRARLSRQQ